ncbi:MAG: hypothetical protein LBP64_11410, partial [Tannerella sp.]|nr:hypothetical protein [Tannerella sp.]
GGDSVKVNVSWTPSTLKATVYVTTIENGSGTLTERTELTSTPSRYGYAAGKVTSDRMIKIDFTVTDGVRTDVETLMIRYRNN